MKYLLLVASIFGLDGVEAGFAPEKVFDVIC